MVTTPNYDLDIDTTLGGSNASDYIIPSQKAIKAYVDNNSGSTVDQTYDGTSSNAQSGVAIAGELTKYAQKAVDTDITGIYNFKGQKKIKFTQSSSSDKLGFTLYNNSNVEKGYLEYNPSNTVDSVPLMTLGNYATASAGLTHVGFRKYSSISGASGAYNLLAPLISDAKTPFNLTTTYTNFYLPLGFTNGSTTVQTAKSGMVDISTLLPDVSNFVTNSSLATTLSSYATQSWVGQQGYLQNTATGTNALTLLGTATNQSGSINIGYGSSVTNSDSVVMGASAESAYAQTVAIGYQANANDTSSTAVGYKAYTNYQQAVAYGYDAQATAAGTAAIGSNSRAVVAQANAFGFSAKANNYGSTALGYNAVASANYAIQIGNGTNSTASTLAVGFNGTNYQLLDGTTGLIPDARMSSNIARTSNVPTIDQTFDGTSTNGQSGVSIIDLLDTLYPVGSIYIGTMATCPLEALGVGTWTLKSSGQVLQGSDANNTAGSSVSASLPQLTANSDGDHSHNRGTMEISGGWNIRHAASSNSNISVMSGGAGAISVSSGSGNTTSSSLSYASNSSKQDVATLKASDGWSGSTNTTGAHTHTVEWTGNVGTTVQPPAYIVNIWERIA